MTYEQSSVPGRSPSPGFGQCDLESIEPVLCEQSWALPDVDRSSHTLFVITGGMGNIRLGPDKYPVSIGKCFLALPGTPVEVCPHFNSIALFKISFDRWVEVERTSGSRLYSKTAGGGFIDPGELIVPSPSRILEITQALYENSASDDIVSAYKKTKLFHELLFELVQADRLFDTKLTEQAVIRTIRHIDSNFAAELTRGKLAQMARLSPEYYSLLFKKISGRSVIDYLTRTRIRHAQERLLSNPERLSDIAKKVGYKDEYYLSRKFKQVVGLSPTAYLKSPKKIVSLNPHLTRHLLALQVIPAATICYPWKFGNYQERLDEMNCECRDWATDFSEDELREIQPELILCLDNISPGKLQMYSSIAPTVVIPWYASDWRGHFRTIAHAVGKSQEADAWLNRFNAKAEEARGLIRSTVDGLQSVSILNIRAETSFIYKNRGMGSQVVYGELHLKPPEPVRNMVTDKSSIPAELDELLPAYAADHIVLAVENSETGRHRAKLLLENEQWRSYEASFPSQVHYVSMERWHGYDPLSVDWQLDDCIHLFAYDRPNKFL